MFGFGKVKKLEERVSNLGHKVDSLNWGIDILIERINELEDELQELKKSQLENVQVVEVDAHSKDWGKLPNNFKMKYFKDDNEAVKYYTISVMWDNHENKYGLVEMQTKVDMGYMSEENIISSYLQNGWEMI
jgi:regulator of replication initiation timing